MFWASGLPPNVTSTTKPEYYPGGNKLGLILESVRADLIKEAVLLDLADTDIFSIIPSDELEEQIPSTMETALEPPTTEPETEDSHQDQSSNHPSPDQLPSVVPSSDQSHSVEPAVDEQSATPPQVEPEMHKVPTPVPSLRKKKSRAIRKVDVNQTVISMFEALKKRKLSPEKEADTSQNDPKLTRRNSCSS